MPNDPSVLLSLHAVSAKIGRQGILHDVSLKIADQDWLAVVGGSGAGKSTLLRVIMGLRHPAIPYAGTISFEALQHDFATGLNWAPKGIAYVPQSPAHGLDPLRRLIWQWKQLARYKENVAQLEALFDALGLPEPGSHYPHEWSLGMQQRFLLAMALMDAPKLLVLDEPTSALDSLIAAQVLSKVQHFAREQGISVLMVTHDLSLAERFAKNIVIMEQGRSVESGPANIVLDQPQQAYTRDLVAYRHWQRADRINVGS